MNPTTINRLVAERVMGWKTAESLGMWANEAWMTNDGRMIGFAGWNPALDMNQAMEVFLSRAGGDSANHADGR